MYNCIGTLFILLAENLNGIKWKHIEWNMPTHTHTNSNSKIISCSIMVTLFPIVSNQVYSKTINVNVLFIPIKRFDRFVFDCVYRRSPEETESDIS